MRKKILALVMVVFTAVMMIGCNKTGISLLDEIQKVYSWSAIDSKADFVVEVTVDEEAIKVYGDITSYMCLDENTVEGKITVTKVEADGETTDLTKGVFAIDPISVICKGDKTYISKSYIENILALATGETSKALEDVQSEYIGLDYQVAQMNKASIGQYFDLIKEISTEVDVTEENRNYKVTISDDKLIALYSDLLNAMFESDMVKESFMAAIQETEEITEADYAEMQKAVVSEIDALLTEIKPALKGSNATMNYKFADDSFTANGELNLQINAENGETAKMKMTMTEESKKVAKKEVKLPANTKVYTMEEFTQLLVPNVAYIFEEDVIVKGNVIYVPLKDTMDQLEIPVKYNAKTKAVSVVIDGKESKVSTYIQGGTSYIKTDALEELGFACAIDEDGFVTVEQRY